MQRYTRRLLVCALLVVFASLALLPALVAAQSPITITWWINPWRIRTPDMPADQAPEAEDFPQWISERFMEMYPHVTVRFEVVTNTGYEEKLAAAIAAGQPPDLTRPVGNLAQWVQWGILEPIDDYLTEDDWDDFYDYALAEGAIGGRHYVWPWNNSNNGMGSAFLANVDVFNDRGIALPESITPDFWTVDEFVDMAKKLTYSTSGGANPDRFALALSGQAQDPINIQWPYIFGGSLVDEDARQFTINRPEGVAGLQFMADLIHDHRVAPTGAAGLGIYDVINMFHQGRTALGYGGPYEIGRIHRYLLSGDLQKGMNVRVLPNPHLPEVGPVAYHTTGGFVVFRQTNAEKRRMVMEFAKLLTSTETLAMLESLYYLSARESANQLMYHDLPDIRSEVSTYLDIIARGVRYYGSPTLNLTEANRHMQAMFEAVLSRDKTPQRAADDFVATANRIVFGR